MMFLLCLVRVVVICLLLYILGTLFININTMESTSTGWGYVIIYLPPMTDLITHNVRCQKENKIFYDNMHFVSFFRSPLSEFYIKGLN